MFGAKRRTRRMILLPSTGIISDSNAFTRLEVRRRKWLLPPFVRIKTPDPVKRNRFEVALWVFSLVFGTFTLRGTAKLLLLSKLAVCTRNRQL